ncbi:MAG: LysR family transcriptional regulator [Gordonia sp. (in: high G+C Gram-positive bacteria)]|nr:MAG: LysR family transcriptional regulator [Gordonia sp. (in: high G+C Gram-positive bacteria)]
MDLDLAAARATISVADTGSFSLAAADLAISQQAVSKRVARLEQLLGHQLFDRAPQGVTVTTTGAKFLTHARTAVAAADAAIQSTIESILRIAVHGNQIADANLMRHYLDTHPDADIELLLSTPAATSRQAVIDGKVHVGFARPNWAGHPLPPHIAATPAYLDILHLLVGKDHPLAHHKQVRPSEISQFTAWVPGAGFDSEVADFYTQLSKTFDITLDTSARRGRIGFTSIVDAVASSPTLVTFGGDGTTTPWHPALRRIPIIDPTPMYPIAMLWHASANEHAELVKVRSYLDSNFRPQRANTWLPEADTDLFSEHTH